MAASRSDFEIISELVEAGANLNAIEGKQGRTILHRACEDGNESLVMSLLTRYNNNKYKLDIDAETYAGVTSYQLASASEAYSEKHRRIAQELVKHGADDTPLTIDDTYIDSEDEEEYMPTSVTQMPFTCPLTNVA